ncbi:MAG: hypothetical protein RID59_15310, partial [Hoeflea sp.]
NMGQQAAKVSPMILPIISSLNAAVLEHDVMDRTKMQIALPFVVKAVAAGGDDVFNRKSPPGAMATLGLAPRMLQVKVLIRQNPSPKKLRKTGRSC